MPSEINRGVLLWPREALCFSMKSVIFRRPSQVKLLRVLQDGIYEPLGATESVQADVRIIAATHKDLDQLVKVEKFREDLFYRINVIRLKLPPLRQRKEDIPLLVNHFIRRFNYKQNDKISSIEASALTLLMSYEYPGNIRELENIIERAFVLSPKEIITINDLPENIRPAGVYHSHNSESFEDLSALFIREMLDKHNWNRSKTAQELGIHKTTLWRKMKKLGITQK